MSSEARSRGGSETFYQGLRDPALTASGNPAAWGDDGTRNRSGPALTVNAYVGKGNVTDVRLNLEMNSPFPPGPQSHTRGRPSRNIFSFLPALEAPAGANQALHGGGGGPNSAHMDASLETNKDLSTLAAHYKTQLEQAGCVLTGAGQHEQLAWNTWTLREDDEQWHGFIFILKERDQEYYLYMRMKNDNEGKVTTER